MNYAKAITLTIGFTGQAFFFLRFFIQWIHSEKQKKSVIPEIFWYFSLVGGILLLIYAILRKDIVFIVGQSTGTFIYLRNIWLLRKERQTSLAYND
ncbi:MAG TPA: lipid-A-disaccharide synthase N-terminal domain-containing protein [Geobacteraceae bacterium]|nr:lipid-A-disaccharide synthase N-terminal domain-containing protein [Geobacteraceae bacterium]